jgi:phage gp36-like protein
MAQYASQADLSRYGLPLAATSGLDGDDLDGQLAAASSVAESYLSNRGYAMPLDTWGDDLRSTVARIAAWSILTNLRGVNPEDPAHDAIRLGHQDAIYWLRDVAKGVANLSEQSTSGGRKGPGVMQLFSASNDDGSLDRGW